jgi:S1-C subfamily serine protease
MDAPPIRSLTKVAIVAAVFSTSLSASQLDLRSRGVGPEFLVLQGPGSDIRVTVRALRAADHGPQGQSGVVIERITRGGPADTGGLRAGDIVTEFDSVALTGPGQFGRIVRDTLPDRPVKLIFWREGRPRGIMITPVAATPQ